MEFIFELVEVFYIFFDEIFLQNVMDIIEGGLLDFNFNVEWMVKELGISCSKFYVSLKVFIG